MPGPWEKYNKPGPWKKYGGQNQERVSVSAAEPEPSMMKQLGESAFESLPGLGAMAGGTIGGAMAGIPGAIGGAAGGAYLGKSAQNFSRNLSGSELAPKNRSDYLTEPLTSAAEGAMAEILGHGIAKGLAKGVGNIGKKSLGQLGLTREAIEARIAGRAQDSAKNYSGLADDLARGANQLREQSGKFKDVALQKLGQTPEIPRDEILKIIDLELSKTPRAISDVDLEKKKIYDKWKEIIPASYPEELSQKEMREIAEKISGDINWRDQASKPGNNALKSLSHQINNHLSTINPEFSSAMKPSRNAAAVRERIARNFKLEHGVNEDLIPTQTTAETIQGLSRENKDISRKSIERLKKMTGINIEEGANDYRLSREFQPKSSKASSKMTNLGAATFGGAGGAIAGLPGAAVGAAMGAHLGAKADRMGGVWAGKLIDAAIKSKDYSQFGKFAPLVEKAVKVGPEAIKSLGVFLSQDEDFKKLFSGDQPASE